jgi:hypothetical protein
VSGPEIVEVMDEAGYTEVAVESWDMMESRPGRWTWVEDEADDGDRWDGC